MKLTRMREEEAGWYTCLVTNPFDSLFSTGYVEVTQSAFDFYTGLSVGLAVVVCLAALVVTITCLKYRKEKLHSSAARPSSTVTQPFQPQPTTTPTPGEGEISARTHAAK